MAHKIAMLVENPFFLGPISGLLIMVPIMGIWAIHKYNWQHWEPFDKHHK